MSRKDVIRGTRDAIRVKNMVNVYDIVNKLLRVRGNIVKVRFVVGNRTYEAYVPDDEYWGSVKDILLNREYEYIPLFNIENLKDFTVIDVGAHVGLYSLVVSSYAQKVISIEPHPVNYRLLEMNKILNDVKNMIMLNAAIVGLKVDTVELCESTHSGGASTMMKSSSRCHTVKAITLDDVIKSYAMDDRILLKMDIEGAEFEVFKSIDLNLLKHIERLVMEIHPRHGFLDIILNKLKLAGFTMRYFHPPLIARDAKPQIKVRNMVLLKTVRAIMYSMTKLCKLKDRNLVILFAWKER